mgnify:FL=1
MHPQTLDNEHGVIVRAFLPQASACEVVDFEHKPERRYPMMQLAPEGYFEVFIAKRSDVFRYQLRATLRSGDIR